jgi:molybdenum cofactor cytidylyltransferase
MSAITTQKSLTEKRVAGIILAAGKASRMGKAKQLLAFQGKPLLQTVINHVHQSVLAPIIVVLGHGAEEILRRVDFQTARIIISEKYILGQSESLKSGVSEVPSFCDGALFILGDQPLITYSILDRIVNAFYDLGKDIVIPTYDGKRSNPVLISKKYFCELLKQTGDVGGRKLLQMHQNSITEVEVGSAGLCMDIDTPEDYLALCQLYGHNSDGPGKVPRPAVHQFQQ